MSGDGGGGGGLSKLGTALTIIFGILVAALLAQLLYVFWRCRIFHRRTNTSSGGGNQLPQYYSSDSSFSPIASSKELLYLFCIRSNSRLERNIVSTNSTTNDLNSNYQQSEMEVIDIDLMKIRGMFGPPRFLFTIKEKEKEDMDSPAEKSLNYSEDKINESKRVSLEAEEETMVTVEIDDATPFSTPCASPLYFTPSTSPIHEVVNDQSMEEDMAAFVRLEV